MIASLPARTASIVLTALIALSSVAAGQIGTLVSPPSPIHPSAGSDTAIDSAPSLIASNSSVWTCVFATNNPGLSVGGDFDIVWTRSRDQGVSWSPPVLITPLFATDTATDVSPALATTGLRRMAVWASNRSSVTGHLGIYSAYSSYDGTNWVNQLPLSISFSTDAIDDDAPCIAGAVESYVVVWERNEGSGDRDLYFSRTTANGGPANWSTPARLDPNSATQFGSETNASITTDGAGNWVVVFDSVANSLLTGSDAEILSFRSSDDGITWVGPTLVNTTGVTDGTAYDTNPAMAVDRTSGTWLCTWRTLFTFGGTTGGDGEIVCAKSTDLGLTWSAPVFVNTDYLTDQASSTGDDQAFVHADQRGHFMLSWTRTMTNDSDTDVRVARSDDLGTTWSSADLPDIDASPDSGADAHCQVVSDAFGHWVCVWDSNDQITPALGPDTDVLSSRFLLPNSGSSATFCYGYLEDGNGSRCPCANDADVYSQRGCLNSTGESGQLLVNGTLLASLPTELIAFNYVPAGGAILLFQGTGQLSAGTGIPFGDGRLCVGGTITRLGIAFAGGTGSGSVSFSTAGAGVSAGQTFFYQGWYRDAVPFCTSATFNLTNAFAAEWAP